MKQTTDITEDLATGEVEVLTTYEQFIRDYHTTWFKGLFGDCDNACAFDDQFGWVPEADCPVHDITTGGPNTGEVVATPLMPLILNYRNKF